MARHEKGPDMDAIRAHYFDVGSAGRELTEGISGIGLYSGSNMLLLPGVPAFATFTELGQPWVDKAVLRHDHLAKIYPVILASIISGAFFEEFDVFSGRCGLDLPRGWQAVALEAPSARSFSVKYFSSSDIFGASPEWRAASKALICLDQYFERAVHSLFVGLLFDHPPTAQTLLAKIARFVIAWPESVDPRELNDGALLQQLEHLVDGSEGKRIVEGFLSWTEQDNTAIRQMFWSIQSELKLKPLFPHRAGCADKYRDQQHQYIQFVKSMIFHFVLGHEYGHACYSRINETKKGVEISKYVTQILQGEAHGSQSHEESFSDFLGLLNCIFQIQKFEIPIELGVAAVEWVWLFASAGRVTQLDVKRRSAMSEGWQQCNHVDTATVIGLSCYFHHLFSPLMPFLRSKVCVVGAINERIGKVDGIPAVTI